jgi:CRISPR-associated protein Cmr6
MPVNVPELGLEITTCHYPDYYGAKRGPTEDQNPMPLPFLAVMNNGDTFFDFTFLVSNSLSSEEQNQLKEAFRLAISEHGFGAKTALGHGRFSCDTP